MPGKRRFSTNTAILLLALAPLLFLVFTQNCSPMKSLANAKLKTASIGGGTGGSDKNICSNIYAPLTTASMSKASAGPTATLFDLKKFHLNTGGVQKASAGPLKVTVVIDMNCQVSAGSLSDRVIQQNPPPASNITRRAFEYTLPDGMELAELETLSAQDACVLGVTNHGYLKISSLPVPAFNDPDVINQGHLGIMNYAHAYEYFVNKQDGTSKALVGFIDTGADCSHSDLAANLVAGCGYNAITPSSPPTDNDGHGSHTAGIVGAVQNNNIGVAGIAGRGALIHAIKVIDVSQGSQQDVYNGIQWAINNNIDIINVSLESSSQMTTVEQGVQEAVNAGLVVIMAAGNHGQVLGDVYVSPAMLGRNLSGAITVGSIDSLTGLLSDFSNYGSNVEIAATGAINSSISGAVGGIYSTYRAGGYSRLMGTSQAAPMVTGAAALLVQFFRQHGKSFTNADIENLIRRSSDSRALDISGGRVLNFSKLVRAAYQFAGVPLCN